MRTGILGLFVLLVLAACDRVTPVEVELRGELPRLDVDTMPQPLGQFTVKVENPAVKGSSGDQPLVGTGVAIPPNSYVRVRIVSGTLTLQPNPQYQPLCASGTPCFPLAGTAFEPGDENYGVRVTVASTPQPPPGASVSGMRLTVPGGGAAGDGEVLLHNAAPSERYLWVKREGPPGGAACAEHTCYPPSTSMSQYHTERYVYSGNQVLEIIKVPNPVRVRAAKARLAPDETTTFTLAADGPLVLNDAPATISWFFQANDTLAQPGGGGRYMSVCEGARTCTYKPQYSGRMYVHTYVQGLAVRAQVLVWVRSCVMFASTTDSLLLDPVVQNTLEDLWKKTRYNEPPANRSEQGGLFLRKDGTMYFEPNPGPNDLCSTGHYQGAEDVYRGMGYEIVARVHTHPIGPSKISNPGNCAQNTGSPMLRFHDGPSPRDLNPWKQGTNAFPGFALDPTHIHRWDRRSPSGGPVLHHRTNLSTGASACLR